MICLLAKNTKFHIFVDRSLKLLQVQVQVPFITNIHPFINKKYPKGLNGPDSTLKLVKPVDSTATQITTNDVSSAEEEFQYSNQGDDETQTTMDI